MRALKRKDCGETLLTELLILPDGRIMAHNLTVEMGNILKFLGLADDRMDQRIPNNADVSSSKTS
jgi:hypothetical protein